MDYELATPPRDWNSVDETDFDGEGHKETFSLFPAVKHIEKREYVPPQSIPWILPWLLIFAYTMECVLLVLAIRRCAREQREGEKEVMIAWENGQIANMLTASLTSQEEKALFGGSSEELLKASLDITWNEATEKRAPPPAPAGSPAKRKSTSKHNVAATRNACWAPGCALDIHPHCDH